MNLLCIQKEKPSEQELTEEQLALLQDIALFTPPKIMKLYKNYDESLTLIEQLDFKYQKVAAIIEYMVELRRIMREDSQ